MELPPQIVKHQVRNLAANQDALSLRGGVGLQAGGNRLPVLQAFQEFLEIERRKARRRLVATGLVFLGLLVAVLVTASVLYTRLARRVTSEVAKLERALAQAREETGALRGDGEAMRRALEEAQQAVDALRARAEREPARAAEIDLALFASTLDVLRRLQDLQPEWTELSRRTDALAREADELEALSRALTERRMRWRAERRTFETAIASFEEDCRRALASWSNAARALDGAKPESERGLFGRRSGPPPAAIDPTPAWIALEALTQSKFMLPEFRAKLDRLEREADAIQSARREAVRRATEWREEAIRIASAITDWRSRCSAIAGELDGDPPRS